MSIGLGVNNETIRTICAINPALCQQPTTQPTVRINTLPNGTPQISSGGTTLDKLLAALSTNLAIIKGAGYIPTMQQPVQQGIDYAAVYAAQQYQTQNQGNTGANIGASIEQFVTQNTGLLLVAGIAIVLFKSGRK